MFPCAKAPRSIRSDTGGSWDENLLLLSDMRKRSPSGEQSDKEWN